MGTRAKHPTTWSGQCPGKMETECWPHLHAQGLHPWSLWPLSSGCLSYGRQWEGKEVDPSPALTTSAQALSPGQSLLKVG